MIMRGAQEVSFAGEFSGKNHFLTGNELLLAAKTSKNRQFWLEIKVVFSCNPQFQLSDFLGHFNLALFLNNSKIPVEQ
jgi:hypothetical protein